MVKNKKHSKHMKKQRKQLKQWQNPNTWHWRRLEERGTYRKTDRASPKVTQKNESRREWKSQIELRLTTAADRKISRYRPGFLRFSADQMEIENEMPAQPAIWLHSSLGHWVTGLKRKFSISIAANYCCTESFKNA